MWAADAGGEDEAGRRGDLGGRRQPHLQGAQAGAGWEGRGRTGQGYGSRLCALLLPRYCHAAARCYCPLLQPPAPKPHADLYANPQVLGPDYGLNVISAWAKAQDTKIDAFKLSDGSRQAPAAAAAAASNGAGAAAQQPPQQQVRGGGRAGAGGSASRTRVARQGCTRLRVAARGAPVQCFLHEHGLPGEYVV